jgi:hypothetical protein
MLGFIDFVIRKNRDYPLPSRFAFLGSRESRRHILVVPYT